MLLLNIRLRHATLGLAATMLASCALLEPQAERYSPPPVGTTYERDIRQTGSYGKSFREVSKYLGERSVMGRTLFAHERSTGQTSMLDSGGGWVGQFKGESPIFTFEPSMTVGYPMKVGKTTTKEVRLTMHAQKRVLPFQSTWKVEAYEDVTVPAGTFKAFRVSYQDSLGATGMNWINPDTGIFVKWSNRRSEKHPMGAGTQDAELLSVNTNR
ncbi:MAG: hypothetical protein OEV81_12240 [Betaproteobacteria bacterium]|nr:hypothetical protein [Betaproteobacteria bacterium]MDH5220214.1 hypothetical protein [Betaproteobacteria bacterium]MDH5350898.1 hypothetical protein [Betaproteobacteria bacterium]